MHERDTSGHSFRANDRFPPRRFPRYATVETRPGPPIAPVACRGQGNILSTSSRLDDRRSPARDFLRFRPR